MKSMLLVILDFDHTLFDAQRFKEVHVEELVLAFQSLGVTFKQVKRWYDSTYADSKVDGLYVETLHQRFIVEQALEAVPSGETELIQLVERGFERAMGRAAECVYEDVNQFQTEVEQRFAKNFSVNWLLLSWGEACYQQRKVSAALGEIDSMDWSGVGVEDKLSFLQQFDVSSVDRVWLINDRPAESRALAEFLQQKKIEVESFFMKRVNGKYLSEFEGLELREGELVVGELREIRSGEGELKK